MICPVCNMTISDKRKKQIKHMHGHSSRELALEILWLNARVRFYQDVIRQRDEDTVRAISLDPVEQPATLALDDPAGLWPLPGDSADPGDPVGMFTLVEDDSQEDSDQAMAAAGMDQCAHCGLWVWPGDMPYHLDVACSEIGEQPGPDDGVHDPGDYQTAPAAEERGDYAKVEYIRIPVDGAEYMLLNALALYIHRTNGNA